MPAIHVRDVPESVISALRERADRHGHSMQQELREILGAAAAERVPDTPAPAIKLHTVRTIARSTWRREEIYGEQGR